MTFDTAITVYNTRYNEQTGFDDYTRTEIQHCSWYSKIRAASGQGGMSYDRFFQVRILDSVSQSEKEYVPPEAFQSPELQYTLSPGSIILKGIGPPAPDGPDAVASLLTGQSEAFRVLDYHDNRRAGLQHLYAEGK